MRPVYSFQLEFTVDVSSELQWKQSCIALSITPMLISMLSTSCQLIIKYATSAWASELQSVSDCDPAFFFFAMDVHFCFVRYRGDLISISQTFFWTQENFSTDSIKKKKVHALMPLYTQHPDEARRSNFHRFQFCLTNSTAFNPTVSTLALVCVGDRYERWEDKPLRQSGGRIKASDETVLTFTCCNLC